jgi:VanZ family protein
MNRIVIALLKPFSFIPAILMMSMIFSFSSQNGTESSHLSEKVARGIFITIDHVMDRGWDDEKIQELADEYQYPVRKLAHMTEYCLLAIAISFPLYVYGVRGIWLILLAVGSFLAADGFVLRRMWSENIFWTLLTAVLIGAAVLYGIVLLYTFPLLARFENTTFGILKTAFLVGVRYLFCTLLMAAIYGIMGYVIVFVFTPAFLLGMGLCAMLCSFLMLRILYQIGGDPDAVHEEYDHDEN